MHLTGRSKQTQSWQESKAIHPSTAKEGGRPLVQSLINTSTCQDLGSDPTACSQAPQEPSSIWVLLLLGENQTEVSAWDTKLWQALGEGGMNQLVEDVCPCSAFQVT